MRVAAAIAFGAALVVAGASGAAGERVPDRLAWSPPALSNPVTVSVTNANSRLFLDDSRDYRLNIAEPLKRELWIEGGRNVVVIGGHINIDQLGGGDSYQDNTALKIRYGAAGGTVHVEGLLIDGPYVADGIALATPRNVQIENVRVERTYNNIKGAHADCVQVQQGVGQLRMDRFTCTTEHQGVFLDGSIGGVDLRRVNLHGAPGRHLLWQTTPSFDVALTNVRLDINPQYQPWAPFGFWVYPQRDGRTYVGVVDRKRHAVVSRDGKRLWFVGSKISGVVRRAPAGARDFVPLGGSGPGYVPPGYVRGAGS
jgi:hypothetical protein